MSYTQKDYRRKDVSVMSDKTYIDAVRSRLPDVYDLPPDITIENHIEDLQKDGFTVDEAVAYSMCMEEFNPPLAEDVALVRMAQIRNQVEKRRKGCHAK